VPAVTRESHPRRPPPATETARRAQQSARPHVEVGAAAPDTTRRDPNAGCYGSHDDHLSPLALRWACPPQRQQRYKRASAPGAAAALGRSKGRRSQAAAAIELATRRRRRRGGRACQRSRPHHSAPAHRYPGGPPTLSTTRHSDRPVALRRIKRTCGSGRSGRGGIPSRAGTSTAQG